MIKKTRQIFIRIDGMNDIVNTLRKIKEKQEKVRKLFLEYDNFNYEENRIFENWNNYLEDLSQRLDYITL